MTRILFFFPRDIYFASFDLFRRLQRANGRMPDEETTAMTEVIVMAKEMGTGTSTQNHELLVAVAKWTRPIPG